MKEFVIVTYILRQWYLKNKEKLKKLKETQ